MMLRLNSLALIGLLLTSWSPGALAQEMPAAPEGNVLDLAEVLDATTEARIERLLAESQEKTGIAMKVVTMTDIARHGGGGEQMEDYAAKLLQTWQGEAPEKNDSILIVISTESANARIALGSDYAPVYDERAARVLGSAVLPAFREDRIPAGIEAGVLSARDQLIAPFLAGAPVTASEGFQAPVPKLPSSLAYVLLGGGIAGTGLFFVLRKARLNRTCPRCDARKLTRTFEVIEAPSKMSPGSGIEHRLCRSCGFTDRQVYTLEKGSGGRYRRTLGK